MVQTDGICSRTNQWNFPLQPPGHCQCSTLHNLAKLLRNVFTTKNDLKRTKKRNRFLISLRRQHLVVDPATVFFRLIFFLSFFLLLLSHLRDRRNGGTKTKESFFFFFFFFLTKKSGEGSGRKSVWSEAHFWLISFSHFFHTKRARKMRTNFSLKNTGAIFSSMFCTSAWTIATRLSPSPWQSRRRTAGCWTIRDFATRRSQIRERCKRRAGSTPVTYR